VLQHLPHARVGDVLLDLPATVRCIRRPDVRQRARHVALRFIVSEVLEDFQKKNRSDTSARRRATAMKSSKPRPSHGERAAMEARAVSCVPRRSSTEPSS
jgi:hypothetical protein